MYKMKLEIRIEIAIKMRFFRNGNRIGFRNDNKKKAFTYNLLLNGTPHCTECSVVP